MIVVDASVLANVLADDEADGNRAREELRQGGELLAPDLVDVETVAVLRKRWLATTLDDQRFAAAVADLADVDMQRFPTLAFMARAHELRANVTPYDAVYVALAETMRCPLVTADRRLSRAPGLRCQVKVVKVG